MSLNFYTTSKQTYTSISRILLYEKIDVNSIYKAIDVYSYLDVTTVHRARSSSWMAFFICQSKNLSVITFLSEFLGKLCSILWKKTLLGHTKSSEEFLFFFFLLNSQRKILFLQQLTAAAAVGPRRQAIVSPMKWTLKLI